MRFALLMFAAPALLSAATPSENEGVGDYQPPKGSVLRASNAPPLSEAGNDVLRFSRSPALGGGAYVVLIRAVDRDWAKGTVRFYNGHPVYGWKAAGSLPIDMSRADYDDLMRRVDAAMARGEPALDLPDGAMIVCTDGPGYVSERRHAGKTHWLSGFCGERHPNVEIAHLVEGLIDKQLGHFFRR